MPVELFGLSIGRAKKEALANQTPVENQKPHLSLLPELDDALPVDAGVLYGIGLILTDLLETKVNLLQISRSGNAPRNRAGGRRYL